MNTSDDWIKDELLELMHSVAIDLKIGAIDIETFRERILKLADRYERSFVKKEQGSGQNNLF